MNILIHTLLVVGTFFAMEAAAWFTHKYIMHGFLWSWHKSHHTPRYSHFEKNDLFAVVFSIPSIATIVVGFEFEALWFLKWVGFGILAYGIFYVLFHDILVHRRVKIKFIAKNSYLRRMIRAHKIHHKHMGKDNAEAFGFLYAPKKYEPISATENVEIHSH